MFGIRSSYDQRIHPRRPVSSTSTPLGQVVDVSEGGVGIFVKGEPKVGEGDTIHLEVTQGDHQFVAECRVVRVEEVGLARSVVGLEFVEVDEVLKADLSLLTLDPDAQLPNPRATIAA